MAFKSIANEEMLFGINQYDAEGDQYDTCIQLTVGPIILRFESVDEMEAWADKIKAMTPEIREALESGRYA